MRFTLFALLTSSTLFVVASTTSPATPLPHIYLSRRRHPVVTVPKRAVHKKSSAASSRAKRVAPQVIDASKLNEGSSEEHDQQALRSRQLDGVAPLPLAGANGEAAKGGAPASSFLPVNGLSLLDLSALLGSSSKGMTAHQAQIKKLATKAKKHKTSRMSSQFQDSVYQELKAYRGSAPSLPGLAELDQALKPLGENRNEPEHFDRSDPLQVAIRTINTSVQDTLEAINLIVFHVPVLGPVLGPILYDIKCIIDDLLNIIQIVANGALSNFSPGLTQSSGNYLISACRMGPSLPVC